MMGNSIRFLEKSVKYPPDFTKFLPERQYSSNKLTRLQPPLHDSHRPAGGITDIKEIRNITVWTHIVIYFKFNHRKPNQQAGASHIGSGLHSKTVWLLSFPRHQKPD